MRLIDADAIIQYADRNIKAYELYRDKELSNPSDPESTLDYNTLIRREEYLKKVVSREHTVVPGGWHPYVHSDPSTYPPKDGMYTVAATLGAISPKLTIERSMFTTDHFQHVDWRNIIAWQSQEEEDAN